MIFLFFIIQRISADCDDFGTGVEGFKTKPTHLRGFVFLDFPINRQWNLFKFKLIFQVSTNFGCINEQDNLLGFISLANFELNSSYTEISFACRETKISFDGLDVQLAQDYLNWTWIEKIEIYESCAKAFRNTPEAIFHAKFISLPRLEQVSR